MKTIGTFDLLEELGQGAFGVVYRARDRELGREVAIKVLHRDPSRDPELVVRFRREAAAAAQLSHPNIVSVYQLGDDEGTPFIAMELLGGRDLADLLVAQPMLPLDRSLDIVRQIARGLGHAHERGIVHRDVKPSNVRVLDDGQVKLLDFGLARLPQSSLTRDGRVLGTPAYMAPEQLRGVAVDQRADVFSLGVVLYELLAGRRPFLGGSYHALMYQVLQEEPGSLDEVLAPEARWLDGVVRECLQKDPQNRVPDCRRLLELLGDEASGPSSVERPPRVLSSRDETRTERLGDAAPGDSNAETLEGPTLEGQTLEGRYQVLSLLGEGGMGRVYRAEDTRMSREVVLKVPLPRLLQNPKLAHRFASEVRSLIALVHPFVVPIYDAGSFGGLPYAVLRYLSGGDLTQRLEEHAGCMDPEAVLEWLTPIAEALDFIHSEGFVHLDVKPGNILFDGRGRAYLGDFGIARALLLAETERKRESGISGTIRYLPPEAGCGADPSPSWDQYALASTVYRCLSGTYPHDAASPELLMAEKMRAPAKRLHARVTGLGPAAHDAVMRALSAEPADRHPSCGSFARSFAAGAGHPSLSSSVSSSPDRRPVYVGLEEPTRLTGVPAVGTSGTQARGTAIDIVFRPLEDPAGRPAAGEIWIQPRRDATRRDLAALALECGAPAFPREGDVATRIVVSSQPTFDDLLATTFVKARAESRPLPAAAQLYASYGALLREGFEPADVPLTVSIEGTFLALRCAGDGDLASPATAARFLHGWSCMEVQLLDAMDRGIDPFQTALFERAPEFSRERTLLSRDRLVYGRDVAHGERWVVHLQDAGGPLSGLVLNRPKSLLFKNWSRRDEQAPQGERYAFLVVDFGDGRWVISTDPLERLSLKALALKLQSAERAASPAADADPWFDGAPFQHTMIAAPKAGTRLPREAVLSRIKAWARAEPTSA